jgi:hypothetical protein
VKHVDEIVHEIRQVIEGGAMTTALSHPADPAI